MDFVKKLLLFFVECLVAIVSYANAFLKSCVVGSEADKLLPFIFKSNAHLLLDDVLDTVNVVLRVVQTSLIFVTSLNKIRTSSNHAFGANYQSSLVRGRHLL